MTKGSLTFFIYLNIKVNQSVESSALPQPYLESSESAILPEKISSSSEQLVASSNHLDQRTKLLNDIKNGTHLSHVQRLSDTSSPKTSNNLSIYDELKNIIIKRGEIMSKFFFQYIYHLFFGIILKFYLFIF